MIGGTETVASVIEWAMTELMKNPEELKKVQAELSNVEIGRASCRERV